VSGLKERGKDDPRGFAVGYVEGKEETLAAPSPDLGGHTGG